MTNSLIKCSKKHSNSIDPGKAKQLSLEQMKKLTWRDEVYVQGNCGHFLRVRINGKPKLWKRTPSKVQVPYSYGLYEHGYIKQGDVVLVPK